MKNCIFCQIVAGKSPNYKLYEDKDFLAFLDINPMNFGHFLIISKKHYNYIFDLPEPLYSKIFKLTKKLSKPLKLATKAKRIGIAIEGLAVPHLHIHMVPLNNLSDLDPNRAKRALDKELKRTHKMLKKYFK